LIREHFVLEPLHKVGIFSCVFWIVDGGSLEGKEHAQLIENDDVCNCQFLTAHVGVFNEFKVQCLQARCEILHPFIILFFVVLESELFGHALHFEDLLTWYLHLGLVPTDHTLYFLVQFCVEKLLTHNC
jgi:hypothetical protein